MKEGGGEEGTSEQMPGTVTLFMHTVLQDIATVYIFISELCRDRLALVKRALLDLQASGGFSKLWQQETERNKKYSTSQSYNWILYVSFVPEMASICPFLWGPPALCASTTKASGIIDCRSSRRLAPAKQIGTFNTVYPTKKWAWHPS